MSETSQTSQTSGTMRRAEDGRGAVAMERVFDTDVDDLWSAVTDTSRLARWIATFEGEPTLGSTTRAEFTSGWEGQVRVDECDRPHRLLLTLDAGTDDESVIEATLSSEGDRSRLVVEERGLPLEQLPAYGAGWHAHVDDLGRHLAGEGPQIQDVWRELVADYRERPIS